MSGWPSGLRRCVQVAVHFCGRGFESHFWHKIFLGKINSFVGWLYPLKCPLHGSRVAQWKRAGPITQRSVDRNYALLWIFFYLFILHMYYETKLNDSTLFKSTLWLNLKNFNLVELHTSCNKIQHAPSIANLSTSHFLPSLSIVRLCTGK